MTLHLSFVLLFTGFTGIHSITTVSEVSVKVGGSISVPCLYDSKYTNHVKYLCEGYHWRFCSYAVKTNKPSHTGKFSISDDKHNKIFTVTINNVMESDAHYWCAVEIKDAEDVKQYFHLTVYSVNSQHSLYVDHQEVTGFKGEDLTINCHCRISGKRKWCRLGGRCVEGSSRLIYGTRLTIDANVFTVTMTGLKTESSGWYHCDSGGRQMPVNVIVTERPSTEAARFTTISLTSHPLSQTTATVFTHEASTSAHSGHPSVSINLLSFIIALIIIFILMTTLFTWFMWKRLNWTTAQSSAAAVTEGEVIYSDIKHMRRTQREKSYTEDDGDVVYSSVSIK